VARKVALDGALHEAFEALSVLADDRRHVSPIQAFDVRGDDSCATADVERRQSGKGCRAHLEVRQSGDAVCDREVRHAAAGMTHDVCTQPGGGPLRVTQRGEVGGRGTERTRSQAGGAPTVAERQQLGESMQPRPVEVVERFAQERWRG
jgi:hypothetical protein